MAKIVKLTKNDLIRIVEETLSILPNPNNLPKIVTEVEKLVNEGKRTINRMYHIVLDLNLRDVMEDTEKYKKLLQDMTETQEVYSKKHDQYYDSVEAFWDDYLNDNLDSDSRELYNKADKLINNLYEIQQDMDKLIDIFDDILRKMDGSLLDDFTTNYPDQTINVSNALNQDNEN